MRQRQLELFTRSELASMRDRTSCRNYSPERDQFRRDHERHRAWGLTQRHGRRLMHLRQQDDPWAVAVSAAGDRQTLPATRVPEPAAAGQPPHPASGQNPAAGRVRTPRAGKPSAQGGPVAGAAGAERIEPAEQAWEAGQVERMEPAHHAEPAQSAEQAQPAEQAERAGLAQCAVGRRRRVRPASRATSGERNEPSASGVRLRLADQGGRTGRGRSASAGSARGTLGGGATLQALSCERPIRWNRRQLRWNRRQSDAGRATGSGGVRADVDLLTGGRGVAKGRECDDVDRTGIVLQGRAARGDGFGRGEWMARRGDSLGTHLFGESGAHLRRPRWTLDCQDGRRNWPWTLTRSLSLALAIIGAGRGGVGALAGRSLRSGPAAWGAVGWGRPRSIDLVDAG